MFITLLLCVFATISTTLAKSSHHHNHYDVKPTFPDVPDDFEFTCEKYYNFGGKYEYSDCSIIYKYSTTLNVMMFN